MVSYLELIDRTVYKQEINGKYSIVALKTDEEIEMFGIY